VKLLLALLTLLVSLAVVGPASAQLTGSVIVTDPGGTDAPGDAGALGLICNQALDLDLLKVTITDGGIDQPGNEGNENAWTLDPGCTGHIDRLEITTNAIDGVKIRNNSVTPAHDLHIGSGYIRSTGCPPGGHCDGVQGMGGDRIMFENILIEYAGRTGGGGFYPSLGGSETGGQPTDIVCNGCHIIHGATSVRVDASERSGVSNSVVCSPVGAAEHAALDYNHAGGTLIDPVGVNRFPVVIDVGRNEDALSNGNIVVPSSDARCTSEPGGDPPPPPPPPCDSVCVLERELAECHQKIDNMLIQLSRPGTAAQIRSRVTSAANNTTLCWPR